MIAAVKGKPATMNRPKERYTQLEGNVLMTGAQAIVWAMLIKSTALSPRALTQA